MSDMSNITRSLATRPASQMPIWALYVLAERGIPVARVRYWQRIDETTIYAFTSTGLVTLAKR